MLTFCYIIFGILAFILLSYFLLELHYFLRTFLTVLLARICKKRLHILDQTQVSGICLTTDIDSLLTHMNNARFVRELDFAKIDFYERTGLYRCVRNHGGCLVLGATTIRYRRFIKLFSRYVITTKIIYWDEQSIYIEHRFITPSDNFINAIVLCRTRATNCNANSIVTELLMMESNGDGHHGPQTDTIKDDGVVMDIEETAAATDNHSVKCHNQKPEMTLELAKWIESNEISSGALRMKSNK